MSKPTVRYQFEYRYFVDEYGAGGISRTQEELNALGKEGWHCHTAWFSSDTNRFLMERCVDTKTNLVVALPRERLLDLDELREEVHHG